MNSITAAEVSTLRGISKWLAGFSEKLTTDGVECKCCGKLARVNPPDHKMYFAVETFLFRVDAWLAEYDSTNETV